MGKLLRIIGAAAAYFSIGTVVAMVIIVAGFIHKTQLNHDKWMRMLAAAYGLELPAAAPPAAPPKSDAAPEQPSFDEMLERRARATRDLELREQTMQALQRELRQKQQSLVEETKRLKTLRENFENELTAMRESAAAAGLDDVRRTLETIKPKQAKEQIVKMLADDRMDEVVELFSQMSDSKRAKIITEFKTPEEAEQLSRILKRVREGVPLAEATDKTRAAINQPQPISP